jgi:WD40 repeat protein
MTPDIRDGLYQAVDMSRLRATLRDTAAAGDTGVDDMALSPDGTNLVAGRSGGAQIWDLSTRTVRSVLPVVRGSVVVAYGERNRIATTSGWSTQIWDASSGAPVSTVGNDAQVRDLVFDPRAERLATVDTEGTARIWDVDRQALLTRFPVSGQPRTVTFDRDGRRLATGDTDGTATIWDPTTGGRLQDFRGHDGAIEAIAFSPDGSLVATASQDSTARIWNAATGQQMATLSGHTNSVFWAGFTPDGERVATTSADGTAKLWDARSGTLLLTLTGHTNPIGTGAFAPRGATLITASWDGTIKIWDATTPHSGSIAGLAFRPGTGDVLATGSADTTAKLWDVGPAAGPTCTPGTTGPATTDRTVRYTLHETHGVGAVAFSPDGALLATASTDKTIKLWNVESGQQVTTLVGHGATVNGMSWNPEGNVLATAAADGVILWDVPSGRIVRRLVEASPTEVYSVAFDPDGARVATGDQYGTLTIWDVASAQVTASFTPHLGPIFKVAFSPQRGSGLLATASLDRTARLWNAENEQIGRFDHDNTVRDLAFSPDGRRLATASWDRKVTVRDVQSGRLQLTISHSAQVNNVAFSPDGSRLATSTSDHGVHIYELDEHNLLALARCRADAG